MTAAQPATFHIRGTITDPLAAVIPGVKVTLRTGQSATTLSTNDAGVYEAELPLGSYTMVAQTRGFKTYNRPLFRVTLPATLTFDIRLQLPRCGDIVITNSSGRPPTEAESDAATESCRHEDLFPVPSNNGTPLQLSVHYETRRLATAIYIYDGERIHHDEPVFVAYNLFSLCADHVVYNAKQRTIEASGNVVVQDEAGRHEADSMIFKFEDGRAIPLQ